MDVQLGNRIRTRTFFVKGDEENGSLDFQFYFTGTELETDKPNPRFLIV